MNKTIYILIAASALYFFWWRNKGTSKKTEDTAAAPATEPAAEETSSGGGGYGFGVGTPQPYMVGLNEPAKADKPSYNSVPPIPPLMNARPLTLSVAPATSLISKMKDFNLSDTGQGGFTVKGSVSIPGVSLN